MNSIEMILISAIGAALAVILRLVLLRIDELASDVRDMRDRMYRDLGGEISKLGERIAKMGG